MFFCAGFLQHAEAPQSAGSDESALMSGIEKQTGERQTDRSSGMEQNGKSVWWLICDGRRRWRWRRARLCVWERREVESGK